MTNYEQEARELFDGSIAAARGPFEAKDYDAVVPTQKQFIAAWLKKRDEERDRLIAADTLDDVVLSFEGRATHCNGESYSILMQGFADEYRKQANALRTENNHV